MLSDKVIKSVKDAKHYFIEQDNYYLKDSPEWQDASRWLGEGSKRLGLDGCINPEIFEKLLQGNLPNGVQLGKKQVDGTLKHRPGWDLTFSAPKSVSILAEVGQDKRIYKAHDKAVQIALSYIEQDCSEARVTTANVTRFQKTKNLIAACFRHDTSREQDPQLHTHCVIMNATQRLDGAWRSQASDKFGYGNPEPHGFIEQIRANKIYYGAIYRSTLAFELKELGYDIKKTHSDGRFEIESVPDKVNKHFSQRRQDIESFLEKKGWSGGKASAFATLETRANKKAIDRDVLRVEWLKRSESLQFNVSQCIQQSYQPKQKLSYTEKTIESIKHVFHRILLNEKVCLHSKKSDFNKNAVQYAISHLSERSAAFTHRELINTAIQYALGDVTLDKIEHEIEKLKEEKILIAGKSNEKIWTTSELIASETQLIEKIFQMNKKNNKPISKLENIEDQINTSSLSIDQKDVACHILTSNKKIILLQAHAGTGKTTLIKNIASIIESQGFTLKGIAPSHAAVTELINGGIPAQTLQSFLLEINKKTKTSTPRKTIYFFDEASMVSTSDLLKFSNYIAKTKSKVILSGDKEQLLSVNAGDPFTLLQKSGVQTVHLTDIKRQDKDRQELVDSIEHILNKNYDKAIKTLEQQTQNNSTDKHIGIIEISDKDDRLQKMANDYVLRSKSTRNDTLLITPVNQDRNRINELVRNGLKQYGEIVAEGYFHPIMVSKYLSKTEITHVENYQKGDFVRINSGLENINTRENYVCVKDIDKVNNRILVETKEGKTIYIDPNRLQKLHKNNIEVYRLENREICIGDQIYFNRSDKNQNIISGIKANVVDVNKNHITIQYGNNNRRKININNHAHLHFDYAYANTAFTAQGKTTLNVITHEDSHYKTTTQRSLYVEITRAKHQVTLYTDDKNKLIQKIENCTGNKWTALEAIALEKPNVGSTNINSDVTQLKQDLKKTLAKMQSNQKNIKELGIEL